MLDAWIINRINEEKQRKGGGADNRQPTVRIPDLFEDPTEEITIPNGERRGWEDITDNGRVVVHNICAGIHRQVEFTL